MVQPYKEPLKHAYHNSKGGIDVGNFAREPLSEVRAGIKAGLAVT
jgi:hypothetical protein